MKDRPELDESAHAVWRALEAGPQQVLDLAKSTGIDQSQISATAVAGQEGGFIEVSESIREELVPSEDAARLLEQGLPERRALVRLVEAGGELPIAEFVSWAREQGIPANEVFRWGGARGWIDKSKGSGGAAIAVAQGAAAAVDQEDEDERALRIALQRPVYIDELPAEGIETDRVKQLLSKRPEVCKIKERTRRTLSLTERGRRALREGVSIRRERNALTTEDLASGAWKEIRLRPYDITLPAQEIYPAKVHPMRKIMEEVRRAFLEMGFAEVISPMVESAFWNFDALFQPQDHPARDMQDTFYMRYPECVDLPAEDVVEAVRRTHEDGWTTGSEGWGYRWDPDRARQVVLRTHTTAATIRALAANPEPPGKYFCVGWTYRNESISYKHLPVFHQVDGIVVDKEANLATLLGTLQKFYQKMGFDKVKFKPAFYPYTEPSVDVVVYMESRRKWLEMGGSGVFRPEVTLPLGCRYPVLAWGLGVERLAMLRCGFSDIRDLYRSNLDALERVALCR